MKKSVYDCRSCGTCSKCRALDKAVIAQLQHNVQKLEKERDELKAERDEWKRRAAAHGCNVEDGDPDCG